MAPSFDCVSSLLCIEDNIIFNDNDYKSTMGMPENSRHQTYHRLHNPSLFFDDVTGLSLQSDECLAIMVEKECQHMPAGDYLNKLWTGVLDSGARKKAIDWIEKVGSRCLSGLALFFFQAWPFCDFAYVHIAMD
ncbi:hypothetical protein K1719_026022 [Acacia pycnantha]|nr:hypothetical protein K1719_026022 [Acacia pycnantha]